MTDGYGFDSTLDCLPPRAPATAMMQALYSVRGGGQAISVGAVAEKLPFDASCLTGNITLRGRLGVWFTTGEGEEIAQMVAAGTLDVSVLEHRIYPLSKVNDALASMDNRDGEFTNFVIKPSRAS